MLCTCFQDGRQPFNRVVGGSGGGTTSRESDTPYIVAAPTTCIEAEEASLHQSCFDHGFENWLNIANVSDTCDAAPDQSGASLIAAFNGDYHEGGWLRKMMHLTAP